ncbi:ssl1498 family light-harvesting-like protein [Calothrix sp. FACHB-156]|nr:ssl1498 family light-harvesting-like protein [Calothrix membranacea FACHB-236]MBD2215081.1 ssl1498 family light-harvesting-like protein [Nostoc linckia FACHB-104]MBD2336608.1 ssl1498 family light-harvesting-like protein [Calothrix sp. FACHB-156]
MYTTINEDGILNNYANEPQIYYADYPSNEEQRSYSFQAGVATLLVTALVLLAFGVS